MANTQWKWCYRSLSSALVFFLICIFSLEFIDGLSGGYALAFVSFFLAITGLAVAAFYFHLARTMDSIMSGMQLLAHWTYSSEEVARSARLEYDNYLERNRAMFFVVGGMLVVASIIMVIFAGEGGLTAGAFLLAFTAILFIVSRAAPVLALKNALAAPKEAYIAENGIIYEGAVYPFQSFSMRMNGAAFRKGEGQKPPVLAFSFDQLVGLNINSRFEVEIPVPSGEEENACKIAEMQVLGQMMRRRHDARQL
jgi:hypothetical protein